MAGAILIGLAAVVAGLIVCNGAVFAGGTAVVMLTFVVTAIHHGFLRCPRCRRHFFLRYPVYRPFAVTCVHCGQLMFGEIEPIA